MEDKIFKKSRFHSKKQRSSIKLPQKFTEKMFIFSPTLPKLQKKYKLKNQKLPKKKTIKNIPNIHRPKIL